MLQKLLFNPVGICNQPCLAMHHHALPALALLRAPVGIAHMPGRGVPDPLGAPGPPRYVVQGPGGGGDVAVQPTHIAPVPLIGQELDYQGACKELPCLIVSIGISKGVVAALTTYSSACVATCQSHSRATTPVSPKWQRNALKQVTHAWYWSALTSCSPKGTPHHLPSIANQRQPTSQHAQHIEGDPTADPLPPHAHDSTQLPAGAQYLAVGR